MRNLLFLISIFTLLSVSCNNDFRINGISVYPDSVSVIEGDSMRINAVIDFSGGKYNEPDLIRLTWSSDNYDIVSVDSTGYIHTHTVGTAIVTVTCEDKSAHSIITVLEDTTSNEIEETYPDIIPESDKMQLDI